MFNVNAFFTNAAGTIFRMPAAHCVRKDSRAFMRVHRDTAWAPDNSVP